VTANDILSGTSGGVVIDVGCNTGVAALPLAGRFPLTTVVVIDAHPVAGSSFLRNRQLNDLRNAHFLAAAIGRARVRPRRRTGSGTGWPGSPSCRPVPFGDLVSDSGLSPGDQSAPDR